MIGDPAIMELPSVRRITDHYAFGGAETEAKFVLQGIVATAANTGRYLSGPITTGARLLAAEDRGHLPQDKTTHTYAEARRVLVTQPNVVDMQATAAQLRRTGTIVVLPCEISAPLWREGDYMLLWLTYIACYARYVIVMPDWELSSGASAEVAMAVMRGKQVTCAQAGTVLSVGWLTSRIEKALDAYGTRLPQHPWILEVLQAFDAPA